MVAGVWKICCDLIIGLTLALEAFSDNLEDAGMALNAVSQILCHLAVVQHM